MQIPTSFFLYGEEIVVELLQTLIDDEDCVGQALYRKNSIQLQCNTASIHRPSTHLEVSFLHELVHWIFYLLEEHELRKNEKLVEGIARLLHQAFTTATYADEGQEHALLPGQQKL